MKTLATDSNNDIYMSNHGLAMTTGAACQSVIIDSLVRTHKGEIIEDKDLGIDYVGTVFQHPRYIAVWAAQVQSAVKAYSWVEKVEMFEYEYLPEKGQVVWDMTVVTTDGAKIRLGNANDRRRRSVIALDVDWQDIINKPNGLEAAIHSLMRMRKEAGRRPFLKPEDTRERVRKDINEVVVEPLHDNGGV